MKVRDCLLSLLECEPDCSQHAVELLPNLVIPESQHDNSMASQKFRARSVANLACTVVVCSAGQLDRQLCTRTIEIQHLIVERMLVVKFVAREMSVRQMPPKNTFGLSRFLPQ